MLSFNGRPEFCSHIATDGNMDYNYHLCLLLYLGSLTSQAHYSHSNWASSSQKREKKGILFTRQNCIFRSQPSDFVHNC